MEIQYLEIQNVSVPAKKPGPRRRAPRLRKEEKKEQMGQSRMVAEEKVEAQRPEEQQEDFFRFDVESLNPSSLPCEDEVSVSEMSAQDLFTPKSCFQNTDLGSPPANYFSLEEMQPVGMKQLVLCQKEIS